LNTPKCIEIIWKIYKDPCIKPSIKYSIIILVDKVLGLDLCTKNINSLSKIHIFLILKRNKARKEKNWELADKIRKKLSTFNIKLEDKCNTTSWYWV
jgi:cysteinyl-tRNA synthetase